MKYGWMAPVTFDAPTSISVLLPVRNEGRQILACLDQIQFPARVQGEILVIDGGSTDDTLHWASQDSRVRVLQSPPGRGTQIAEGYRAALGDLLVIVHADSRLSLDTLSFIWQHCIDHSQVAGGACTARYDHPSWRFRFTEFFSDRRVLWFGIAFGDQVQFFRRAAVPPQKFPDYKLMEDIELSLRIQQAGTLALVHTKIVASHRRWEKVGYTRNTIEVIGLSVLFLVLRSLGLVRDKGAWFYRRYYGG